MPQPQPQVVAAPAGVRLASIDALRGFDMFWIIGGQGLLLTLVGLFGTVRPELAKQLGHTTWEGFTAWDLIMPLFLFIVGAAMPFSFSKRIEAGQSKGRLYVKIVSRVLILWLLGMIAQGNLLKGDWSQLHLFSNTLQAIAAGYLVAGIALLHLSRFGQVILTAALLIGYWALMAFVPFPEHVAGTMEERANLALYIDQAILRGFGDGTTYAWILPSLGFAATVLLGVLSGHLLRSRWSNGMKVVWLILTGGLCLGLGWVISGGPIAALNAAGVTPPGWAASLLRWAESVRFPIIKHLFTSSMVLWAAGWSTLLLALFYLVIDVLGFRFWAFPLIVIGMNAILAYMLAHPYQPLAAISDMYLAGFAQHMDKYSAAVHSLAAFLLLWLVLYYLYRNKHFLRV